MATIEEFTAKELDRLAKEREAAVISKGGYPYLGALPVGESKLILLPLIPIDNPSDDGRPRKQFIVSKEGEGKEYAWTVNAQSPLYRDLLKILSKDPVKIRVIRTGEGRHDTRYTVKKL